MASQQRRRRRLPQPNPNCDTGKSDADSNSYGYIYAGKSDADGYSYSDDATCVAHANSDCDSDDYTKAYADAKAAANAVPSTDAVSERVKKLKELKSYRELARQLASSLLLGESATHHADASWNAAPKASEATFKNVLVDNRRKIVADAQGVVLKPNLPTKHTKRHQISEADVDNGVAVILINQFHDFLFSCHFVCFVDRVSSFFIRVTCHAEASRHAVALREGWLAKAGG